MTGAVPERADVVVLGAGPAGLATAWYAARRDLRVVVVERAGRVGGLAGSLVVDGCVVDFGSHRLHASVRADLLADLVGPLGVDLAWRPRNGRIRLGGRWLAFPLRPADLLRHSPPGFGSRVALDVFTGPVRRRRAARSGTADSFADRVRVGLGPTVAEGFYEPYARKLWGLPADELSADLFRRRVSAKSSGAVLRRLAGRGDGTGTGTGTGNGNGFWYPTDGFGAISDALAAGVVRLGGSVVTGAAVERVGGGAEAEIVLSGGRRVAARTVVSTIPPAALVRALGAPADVIAAAGSLEQRGVVLVYLSVPRPQYTPFDAHYFPEAATVVSRLSEPKNYRGGAFAPPADRTVLCAEIPASVGDDLWTAPDDTLAARVRADLAGMGLPDLVPRAIHVERRVGVYPVYRIGYERAVAAVDEHVRGVTGLAVLGRQALFAHDNTHHSLLMGAELARCLGDDGRLDRARWDTARAAFADHVVED